MMATVPDTGERILLEKESPLMIARHLCAYKFAAGYAKEKRVMDIGCGEGYGSFYLCGFAKEVFAIDYDKAVIDYAKSKYKKDNLHFLAMEAGKINSILEKFDCVCSFQFIEHIPDAGLFLQNIADLLHPGGVFICSTPNKKDASPNRDTPANRFHLKEYLLGEFSGLLKEYFADADISGLKRARGLNFFRRLKKSGIFDFLPDSLNPVKRFYGRIDCSDFILVKDGLDSALDFIAVCRGPKICR